MLKNINLRGKKVAIPGVIVLVLAGLFLWAWAWSNKQAKSWTVVYMSSQEIYVGHLHTFPRLMLTDGYILQNVKSSTDATKTNFQLFPLAEKVWAPTKLYLNRKQILYFGPLSEDSEAAKAIKAK